VFQTKPELQNSTGELKSLSSALQEMNIKMNVMKLLVDIDTNLNLAKQELHNKRYIRVAQILCDIQQLLKSVDGKDEPEILKSLRRESVLRSEAFLYELNNIWRESLVCEEEENNSQSYLIRVNIAEQGSFAELMQALHLYDELGLKLKIFSERLMENIMAILMQKQCLVELSDLHDSIVLRVQVQGHEKDKPIPVIENVKKVFEFLTFNLELRVNSNTGDTFMNLLGNVMSESFCDIFIKEILMSAIPSNNEERQAYDEVVQHTTALQEYLQTIGMHGCWLARLDCLQLFVICQKSYCKFVFEKICLSL
jgi:hypothetical protein